MSTLHATSMLVAPPSTWPCLLEPARQETSKRDAPQIRHRAFSLRKGSEGKFAAQCDL
jgi:hypothetical protein